MKYETYVLQNKTELAALVEIFRKENVKSYLEIGCKFGGSLWIIGNLLPKGSKIVAVDLPHGDASFKETLPPLQNCVDELNKRYYDATLIVGDSTDPATVAMVNCYAPFDACLIDANHTLPYIRKDWENYGPMCRLVCFHDIGFYRREGLPPQKKPIEVPIFWKEVKTKYKTKEIRLDPQDNGIGVLWR
jgi:cephalosporin hydroxylase